MARKGAAVEPEWGALPLPISWLVQSGGSQLVRYRLLTPSAPPTSDRSAPVGGVPGGRGGEDCAAAAELRREPGDAGAGAESVACCGVRRGAHARFLRLRNFPHNHPLHAHVPGLSHEGAGAGAGRGRRRPAQNGLSSTCVGLVLRWWWAVAAGTRLLAASFLQNGHGDTATEYCRVRVAFLRQGRAACASLPLRLTAVVGSEVACGGSQRVSHTTQQGEGGRAACGSAECQRAQNASSKQGEMQRGRFLVQLRVA